MPDLYPKVEDVADKVKRGVTQVEIADLYDVNIPCIHTRVRRARQWDFFLNQKTGPHKSRCLSSVSLKHQRMVCR